MATKNNATGRTVASVEKGHKEHGQLTDRESDVKSDSLTVLRAKLPLAKCWRANGTITPYQKAKQVKPSAHLVRGIRALSRLLTKLEPEPYRCIIRGRSVGMERAEQEEPEILKLRAEGKLTADHVLRRGRCFDDWPLHSLMLDIDASDFEYLAGDPVKDPAPVIADYIATKLPAPFRRASYHWQLSNSAGHPDETGLKVHLWFWLATPRTSAEVKAWAKAIELPADLSVFGKVSVHYTSAPLFDAGVADPVPVRSGFVAGETDEVVVDIDDVPVVDPVEYGELRTEISKDDLRKLKSALAWPALLTAAGDEPFWTKKVGFPLLSTDDDHAIWQDFCNRAPNNKTGDADEWLLRHANTVPTSDYRSILKTAAKLGWPGVAADPDEFDVVKVAPPASGKPATDPYTTHVDFSDTGNANVLIKLTRGDLRFIPELNQWLWWDGKRWIADDYKTFVTGQALRVAKYWSARAGGFEKLAAGTEDSDELLKEAKKFTDWARRCRNRYPRQDMLDCAAKATGVPLSAAVLDRDQWLLGVDNGVIDLRTGELREAEAREDYVTKRCPVRFSPAAQAPLWEQFIAQVTGEPLPVEYDDSGAVIATSVGRFRPRPELAAYLQRMLGYCITGSTREDKMFIAIGLGANGKNILFDTVTHVIGRHAVAIPAGALMATKYQNDPERPTPVARSLAGARLALASESKQGHKFDIELVKAHTGDARLTARGMHENVFTFDITHKLCLMTNHEPVLEHLDPAIRGRLHLIPFDRRWNRPGDSEHNPALPDGDKGLDDKLKAESEGILAWLVRGAAAYYKHGLTPPAEVVATTKNYFLEQDHLGRWLSECCERCAPKDGSTAGELFAAFERWCGENEIVTGGPSSSNGFGVALKKRPGFRPPKPMRRGNCHGWRILAQESGGSDLI